MARRSEAAVESWWYVLEDDRELPKAEQSRFLLRPLSVSEKARIYDDIIGDDHRRYGTALDLMYTHVERIENFPAGSAEPWPLDRKEREKYLATFPLAYMAEISGEIINRAGLSPAKVPAPDAPRDAAEEAQSVPNS